jgi:hypothetical protein
MELCQLNWWGEPQCSVGVKKLDAQATPIELYKLLSVKSYPGVFATSPNLNHDRKGKTIREEDFDLLSLG